MEDERMLNGFCRAQNAGRMVMIEISDYGDGITLDSVDCGYRSCIFKGTCEIASQIEEALQG